MGFAFLNQYDAGACAQQCNSRGADSQGGACQYFNIWRAVVNGVPTTYTCSMVSQCYLVFIAQLYNHDHLVFHPSECLHRSQHRPG